MHYSKTMSYNQNSRNRHQENRIFKQTLSTLCNRIPLSFNQCMFAIIISSILLLLIYFDLENQQNIKIRNELPTQDTTTNMFNPIPPAAKKKLDQICSTTQCTSVQQDKNCAASLEALLSSEPQIHGKVEKKGVLPLHLWWNATNQVFMKEVVKKISSKNITYENGKLIQNGQKAQQKIEPLPMSGPCGVFINHKFKFIFVKNTKVAGTSIMEYFGWQCNTKNYKNTDNCFQKPDKNNIPNAFVARKIWKQYFVFTSARNPFTRAASAYNYLLARRETQLNNNRNNNNNNNNILNIQNKQCENPSFKQFCWAPHSIGIQTRQYNCINNHQHDFYHVEDQAHCLKTLGGQFAIDYIISMENLQEDFQKLIQILQQRINTMNNSNKNSSNNSNNNYFFDKTSTKLKQLQKGPLTQERDSYVVQMFESCGQQCINNLREYYKNDFKFFGYRDCVRYQN
eukprot:TRINITY_DN3515_c0_g1_i11.p1 TRINITY_DN3515_c0_g1~~TRINITY_DN3515_c0_g1_i11.p1  ORF type:complete len:455 (-),score=26.64 TRINITY_DN3515_c0_g1_i11:186-1550(-)